MGDNREGGGGPGEGPGEPIDPIVPADPVEPAEPAEPVEPTEPSEPAEPLEPSEPAEPVEPAPSADEPTTLDAAVEQRGGAASDAAPPNSPALTPAGTETYNLRLDATRRSIAFFLLWIMAGVIAAPVFATIVFSGWCWMNGGDTCTNASTALDLLAKNMSQFVTAMVGLVGSVVGFYFGSKQN